MPSTEAPSYSSSRVQRAYRINGIEQCRLGGTLHLLDKQMIHQTRVKNQDIRMISLSLDYIQSSSGRSPEGMAPGEERLKSESEDSESEEEEDNEPCFMYGVRILSRKVRRVGRPLSAVDRKSSSRGSTASSSDSLVSPLPRPQSSPVRRKPTWQRVDLSSDVGVDLTQGQYDWERTTSDVTKKILRAQAERRKDPRRSLPSSIRRHSQFDDMPPSPLTMTPAVSRTQSPNLYPPRRSSASPLGRSSRLNEILNQRRPTLSANAWKDHLQNANGPMSIADARQKARVFKLKENENANISVQARVQGFIDAYPVKRSSTSF